MFSLLQAGSVRDSMAKSLYSALFDWIVFRINHALLNIKDLVETTKVGPRTLGRTYVKRSQFEARVIFQVFNQGSTLMVTF